MKSLEACASDDRTPLSGLMRSQLKGTVMGSAHTPATALWRAQIYKSLHAAIGRLTDREAVVIDLRFGFNGEVTTLRDVGKVIGVSLERVRQIESKALWKLRDLADTDGFQDWANDWCERVAAREKAARDAYDKVWKRVEEVQERQRAREIRSGLYCEGPRSPLADALVTSYVAAVNSGGYKQAKGSKVRP